VRCFKCLTEVPAGTEVCPHCGQILIPKVKKQNNEKKDPASTQIKQKEYQIGDIIKDRYEVRAVLGKKGTGFTYKVRDKEKKKNFVLKQIQYSLITSDESKERFFDIIKEIIKLNLNEIATIYDYGEDSETIYFVSEYIEGLTLRKLLDVRKEMKQFFKGEELESIITQICKALITAHNNGIVHGDLKPENIFILPSGLKITELGITGSFSPLDFTSIQQDLGDAYKYIAPEVVIGGALSKSSDIYSLGAIAYEMLTGIIPGGVVNPPTNYNSELPQAVNDVVLKALRQDHEQRTQYVSEFYKNLLESFGQKAIEFEEKPWITKQTTETEQAGKLQTEIDEDLLMYVESGTTTAPPETDKPKTVEEEEKPVQPAPEQTAVTKPAPETPVIPTTPAQEKQPEQDKTAEEIKTPVQEPQRALEQTTKEVPSAEQQTTGAESVTSKPTGKPIEDEGTEENIKAEKQEPSPETTAKEEPRNEIPIQQEEILDAITDAAPEKLEQAKPEPERLGIEDIAKHLDIVTDEIQSKGFKKPKPLEPAHGKHPLLENESNKENQPSPQKESYKNTEMQPRSARLKDRAKVEKRSPLTLTMGIILIVIVSLAIAGWFLLKSFNYKTDVLGIISTKGKNNGKTFTQSITVAEHQATETTVKVVPPVEIQATPKQEIEKKVEKPKPEKKIAVVIPKPPPPKCPADMVYIPSGYFIMGSSLSDPLRDFSEKTDVRTYVRAFCIDKYEYPGQEGIIPQTNISFYGAKKLCEDEGKQLCSEEQWEKACKGPLDLKYPYGNVWDASKCNTQNSDGTNRSIVPSGTYRACTSGYGVYDMSGNVMEWTNSVFSSQDTSDRVVKGGSFTKPDWATRCAYRYNMLPNSTSNEVGSRCCKPPER
jgi:serine/threonine protein kinase/formylglycine-generating enzyme required for sulfatase activity